MQLFILAFTAKYEVDQNIDLLNQCYLYIKKIKFI